MILAGSDIHESTKTASLRNEMWWFCDGQARQSRLTRQLNAR